MLTGRRILFSSLLLFAALLAVLLPFLLDAKPDVQLKWTLSRRDLDRAKQILSFNTPRNSIEGAIKKISLSEKDLNVAADYLLNRYVESASQVKIIDNGMDFRASITLPRNPFGGYLNLHFVLRSRSNQPEIAKLNIGCIEISEKYAGRLLERVIRHSALGQYFVLAGEHVKDIRFYEKGVNITYSWNASAYRQARDFFTADAQEDLLIVYQNTLAAITRQPEVGPRISILAVFQPLFELAYQRSRNGDAVAENHALLLVLGSYLNHESIHPLLSFNKSPGNPARKIVKLFRREDMARHFITSAALTAAGSETFADVLGITKEIEDAQDGSGFSFIDLAADRAGARFGRMAVASHDEALQLQNVMRHATSETVFMPNVRDLPENLGEKEFTEAYGRAGRSAYEKMVQQIDKRIADCLLYRS